jgi:ABC-type uncharacterized transport system substrate-binding protein
MRRRDFVTMLGGAAVAWPLAARGQQPVVPVIGFLDSRSPNALVDRLRGFRLGLKDHGYVEGDNVTIVYRWAENSFERLPELAAELAGRRVAVIAASGPPVVAAAAKAVTATIPIVFIAAQDPVRLGLVASLAHPGGNLTGINFLGGELVAKQLDVLHELVPRAARVAVFVNPANPATAESTLREAEPTARVLGLQIEVLRASTREEIDAAFAPFGDGQPGALFVANDAFFSSRRVQIVQLATLHKIPAIYPNREYAEIGGLISYGSNIIDAYRQIGAYIGRILKGAKAADLPVVQSTKFELVINAQTARILGLTVPPTLLARADEVIE